MQAASFLQPAPLLSELVITQGLLSTAAQPSSVGESQGPTQTSPQAIRWSMTPRYFGRS